MDFLTPEDGTGGISETSVRIYHDTLRNTPENADANNNDKVYILVKRNGVMLVPGC